jgi:hypothetical protein
MPTTTTMPTSSTSSSTMPTTSSRIIPTTTTASDIIITRVSSDLININLDTKLNENIDINQITNNIKNVIDPNNSYNITSSYTSSTNTLFINVNKIATEPFINSKNMEQFESNKLNIIIKYNDGIAASDQTSVDRLLKSSIDQLTVKKEIIQQSYWDKNKTKIILGVSISVGILIIIFTIIFIIKRRKTNINLEIPIKSVPTPVVNPVSKQPSIKK